MEIADRDVGKVGHAGQRQVLRELELVGSDEGEGLCLDRLGPQTPRELVLRDEVLRELGESLLVVDVEGRLLLDASVTRRDANALERKVADLDLAGRVARADPVGAHGALEVELRGEDADLLDLTLERERERLVRGKGDVGCVDVEDRRREGVLGDGAHDREDEERDGDGGDHEGEERAKHFELRAVRNRVSRALSWVTLYTPCATSTAASWRTACLRDRQR